MSYYYPLMVDLQGRRCLIAGGGHVAERKTDALLESGADVRVISPSLTPKLARWVEAGRVRYEERKVRLEDLQGAFLLFAATDQKDLNRQLAEEAKRIGILANVADQGEEGDFLTPSVIRRGDLLLTVSLSGSGPALAARIARELADTYGEEYEELAAAMRQIRSVVKAHVQQADKRRELLLAAVSDKALHYWLNQGVPSAPSELIQLLQGWLISDREISVRSCMASVGEENADMRE